MKKQKRMLQVSDLGDLAKFAEERDGEILANIDRLHKKLKSELESKGMIPKQKK